MPCTAEEESFPMQLQAPALASPFLVGAPRLQPGSTGVTRLAWKRDVRRRSNSVNGSEKPEYGRRATKLATPAIPCRS